VKVVQMIVSHWFMEERLKNHDGTCHATGSSLRMRASLATALCEAILTMKPVLLGEAEFARRRRSCKHHAARELGLEVR